MRVNRDGCIEASQLEVRLSADKWISATQVGMYKNMGIVREIEAEIGLRIEGVLRFRRQLDVETATIIVKVNSDWVRPTRR